MPITNQVEFDQSVESNKDGYGKCVVDVAREVMRLLDTPEYQTFDADKILCDADTNLGEGITGFQAGCIAQIVSRCHSRGDEFRAAWNKQYDDKPHPDGVVNPAIFTMGEPEDHSV